MRGGAPASGILDLARLEPDPTAPVGPPFATFPATPTPAPAPAPIPEPISPAQELDAERDAGELGQLITDGARLTLIDGLLGKALRIAHTGRSQTFSISGGGPVLSRKAKERYRIASLIRAPAALTVCLRIQVRTAADPAFPHTTERCQSSTGRWSRMSVTTTSQRRGDRVRVSLNVLSALPGDMFDLDGLDFERH